MLLSPNCNKAITFCTSLFKTKIKMCQLAISMASLRAWPCATKAQNNLINKNMEEMTILKHKRLCKDKTRLSLALPKFQICISRIMEVLVRTHNTNNKFFAMEQTPRLALSPAIKITKRLCNHSRSERSAQNWPTCKSKDNVAHKE